MSKKSNGDATPEAREALTGRLDLPRRDVLYFSITHISSLQLPPLLTRQSRVENRPSLFTDPTPCYCPPVVVLRIVPPNPTA